MPSPGLSTGAVVETNSNLMSSWGAFQCVCAFAVQRVTAHRDARVVGDHWADGWWQPVTPVWTFLWTDRCTHLFPSLEWFSGPDITGVDDIVHLLMTTAKIFSKSETVDVPHHTGHSHMGHVTANIASKRSRQEVINGCKRLDRAERWEISLSHLLHLQMLRPGASCCIC